jgi:uncharacterized protein YodC (DUF2158 family)
MSESKQKFRPGDIVQLKSGGPIMTVDTEEKSEIGCLWFAESELRNGRFSPTSLKLAESTLQTDKREYVNSPSASVS